MRRGIASIYQSANQENHPFLVSLLVSSSLVGDVAVGKISFCLAASSALLTNNSNFLYCSSSASTASSAAIFFRSSSKTFWRSCCRVFTEKIDVFLVVVGKSKTKPTFRFQFLHSFQFLHWKKKLVMAGTYDKKSTFCDITYAHLPALRCFGFSVLKRHDGCVDNLYCRMGYSFFL